MAQTDRDTRAVALHADDMRLVTRDEYTRYKEHLMKDSGFSHTNVKHHLNDLRTLFIFASSNRDFAKPTHGVTRLKRKNARNKWRSYTIEERVKILIAARRELGGRGDHRDPCFRRGRPLRPNSFGALALPLPMHSTSGACRA